MPRTRFTSGRLRRWLTVSGIRLILGPFQLTLHMTMRMMCVWLSRPHGTAGVLRIASASVGPYQHRNVSYLAHSFFLGRQNDSVGPMGSSSVIRTVCLDRAIGSYIHDGRNSLPFNYVSVSKGMIRQLEFRLTDWRGRPVPLTNSWSFSIIFVPEDEI